MKRLIEIFNRYWMLILVVFYFTMLGIYHEFGIARDVISNTLIKMAREAFIVVLLASWIKRLPNSVSILACLAAIAYSIGLTIFRIICAFKSKLNYEIYFEYMKDGDIRNFFTFLMFVLLLVVYYLNTKK